MAPSFFRPNLSYPQANLPHRNIIIRSCSSSGQHRKISCLDLISLRDDIITLCDDWWMVVMTTGLSGNKLNKDGLFKEGKIEIDITERLLQSYWPRARLAMLKKLWTNYRDQKHIVPWQTSSKRDPKVLQVVECGDFLFHLSINKVYT